MTSCSSRSYYVCTPENESNTDSTKAIEFRYNSTPRLKEGRMGLRERKEISMRNFFSERIINNKVVIYLWDLEWEILPAVNKLWIIQRYERQMFFYPNDEPVFSRRAPLCLLQCLSLPHPERGKKGFVILIVPGWKAKLLGRGRPESCRGI